MCSQCQALIYNCTWPRYLRPLFSSLTSAPGNILMSIFPSPTQSIPRFIPRLTDKQLRHGADLTLSCPSGLVTISPKSSHAEHRQSWCKPLQPTLPPPQSEAPALLFLQLVTDVIMIRPFCSLSI